ncbi:MAG TPA: hypothetical protein VG713_21330 [Pirellulales bacterium]|nr:hypothetical protein [Pirellulales bacterium]
MLLLLQFLFRLSFGMAAAMATVSPRQVSSGYYRNNLYVLLGLNVLASLVAASGFRESSLVVAPAVIAALASYGGAVCWLYERPRAGVASLVLIALVTLAGTCLTAWQPSSSLAAWLLIESSAAVSGLVLGVTMAAMLLGHWYLNAPGMQIAPLVRLIALMGVALAVRAALSACDFALNLHAGATFSPVEWSLMALRWLAGLVGAEAMAYLAWRTLKIPNTQSATGILYVAVMFTFLGELAALLLSAKAEFPL